MYKFEFTVSEADYHEFNRFYVQQSWLNRKTSFLLRWLVPVVFVIAFLIRLVRGGEVLQLVIHGVLLAIIAVIWLLLEKRFSNFITNIVVNLAIATTKRDGKLPYGKNTLITFHEDYVHEITEISETKTNYSSFERVAIGTEAIYFFITAISALILPFRVFESEAQIAQLTEFVSAKITKE